VDGGTAEASPRCGITPSEANLIAVWPDVMPCSVRRWPWKRWGRVYGQGVLETSASLQ
jgi:hypothetical protein